MSPYEQFAENMMHPGSRYIPQILKRMIDDDRAALLVAMPGTVAELSEKLGREPESVASDLKAMFRMGLAFKKPVEDDVLWRAPAHLIQFHDATLVWPEAPPALFDLWRRYMEEEWPQLARGLDQLLPRPFTRVVPIHRSLDAARATVLAPDSLRDLIQDARRLAVAPCTCRLSMRKCDAPTDVCMQINRGADYTIERGSGREISKSEALDIIARTEEAGLVHVTMNKTGAGHFICNCCGCCCQAFSVLRSDGLSLCDPSRYQPVVDNENCTGCGMCESRCWFDAVAVGEDSVAAVDAERCLGCGQCAIGCPEGAISMTEVRQPDFIPE